MGRTAEEKLRSLAELKEAVLMRKDASEALETCYGDFLDAHDAAAMALFVRLVELLAARGNLGGRVEEMLKVTDLVRFPVKKSFYEGGSELRVCH